MGKIKFTPEDKLKIIRAFQSGEVPYSMLKNVYGMDPGEIYRWIKRYAAKPNEKWVTDVTEFKWYEGTICHKLYLNAILDLYDRSVIAYVLSRRNNNQLVFQTKLNRQGMGLGLGIVSTMALQKDFGESLKQKCIICKHSMMRNHYVLLLKDIFIFITTNVFKNVLETELRWKCGWMR